MMANRDHTGLSPKLVAEMTAIVFDYPAPPARPCDLVFIFGGTHPGLWEMGAKAYHEGLGRTVLATGGYKPGRLPHYTWTHGAAAEAPVIREELIRLDVPAEHIFIEDRSTNTLENVLFAKEIYDFSSVGSILAVCKNYGVGRQCRTLRRNIDPAVEIIPFPFETETGRRKLVITRDNWMEDPESLQLVVNQVGKIIAYGRRGHLQPVEWLSPELSRFIEEQK